MTAFVILSMLATTPAAAPAAPPPASPALEPTAAARFATLALDCVAREYPSKIAHVLTSDTDARPPRLLTPAFYGCYDWHSAVHGHWLLARLARTFPDSPFAPPARAALSPAVVTDPSDPKLAHLDGLNLSRAWMLEGIASALPPSDPRLRALRATASAHREKGLAAVTGAHYEGGHWLGTFAVYLTTRRGLPLDRATSPP